MMRLARSNSMFIALTCSFPEDWAVFVNQSLAWYDSIIPCCWLSILTLNAIGELVILIFYIFFKVTWAVLQSAHPPEIMANLSGTGKKRWKEMAHVFHLARALCESLRTVSAMKIFFFYKSPCSLFTIIARAIKIAPAWCALLCWFGTSGQKSRTALLLRSWKQAEKGRSRWLVSSSLRDDLPPFPVLRAISGSRALVRRRLCMLMNLGSRPLQMCFGVDDAGWRGKAAWMGR